MTAAAAAQGLHVHGAGWDEASGNLEPQAGPAGPDMALPALSLKAIKRKEVAELGAAACCLQGAASCLWLPCKQRELVAAGLHLSTAD